MTIQQLDLLGFSAAHAVIGGEGIPVVIATTFAQWGLFVVPVVLVWLWLRGRSPARLAAVGSALSAVGALTVAGMLSFLVYRSRPFAAGLSDNVLAHVADSSFPSDHASVMAAVAVSLFLYGCRRSGLIVGAITIVVGFYRVALGIHFPSDVLAGLAIGTAAALAFRLAVLAGFVGFVQRLAFAIYVHLGVEGLAIKWHVDRQDRPVSSG